jgi:hypothetical protein
MRSMVEGFLQALKNPSTTLGRSPSPANAGEEFLPRRLPRRRRERPLPRRSIRSG